MCDRVCPSTWDAFPREDESSRPSRGHRSEGQLSSNALEGPARPATKLFSALFPTSATCGFLKFYVQEHFETYDLAV